MTGYGRASVPLGSLTLTVQISSVNRKTLDLTMKMPEAWEPLEPTVAAAVRQVASRGKVHVDMEVTGSGTSTDAPWDETAAGIMLDRLSAWASSRGVAFMPTPELLWSIASSQRRTTELPTLEESQSILLDTLDTALRSFSAMRAREGETLLVDFLARLEFLRRHLAIVVDRAPHVVIFYREQLFSRLRQAGLELDLGDERVLKEIALFADRCDLTEELTRFRSHVEQFESLLKSDGEVGRKAEFILQEMGREVHTMGSKANDLTISRAVIELKNELEKIREQIANIE